jgi:AcrR family transcriptional regulator
MVWKMKTMNPFARQHIIEVTSDMIKATGSRGIDLGEVAERSGVDISTVESFFDSRTQLIAEAQMANYFSMVEPLHLVLSRVESALSDEDQTAFWVAVEENMEMAWSSGQVNEKWGILNLLHDIWSDPFSQSHFCDLLDIQFDRWITVVRQAQDLGWIDEDIDAKSLTAVFWSASVGQVITAGSTTLNPSSEDVRDFYMRIVRGRKSQGTAAS